MVQVFDTNQRLNSSERSIIQLRKTLMKMSEDNRKIRRYLQRQKSLLTNTTTTISSTDIPPYVCRDEKTPIYITNTLQGPAGGGDSCTTEGSGGTAIPLIASWFSLPRILQCILFVVGCISLHNNFYKSVDTVTDTVTDTVIAPVYSVYNTMRDAISAAVLLRGDHVRDNPGKSELG